MGEDISIRCPVRIDLAGGWSDVSAYCKEKSGEVVNIAINHFAIAEKSVDANRKLSVHYTNEMPIGSGLGTSAAINVALMAAIAGDDKKAEEIAELAYQFEALLGNTGGRQDQWASALGGINHLSFKGEEVEVNRLQPSVEFCTWLQNHLLLFDSNIQHTSGQLHDKIWQRFAAKDKQVIEGLDLIRDAGLAMASAIVEEDISQVIYSLKMVMLAVDLLDDDLHRPFRSTLSPLQQDGSVLAWKAMGAGGGGVVGVLIESGANSKLALLDAAKAAGWSQIEWQIERSGISKQ